MTTVDVFLERRFDPPISVADFLVLAAKSAGCLDLHRVAWQQSLYGAGGRNLICWFRGFDLESVRLALRTSEIDLRVLWSGTVHDAPGIDADSLARANVVVERRFAAPTLPEEIQAIEDQASHCLEMRDVVFKRTFFSLDRKRMLCLYEAPDAESVRQAQREAKMPVEAVWSFEKLDQNALAGVA